jgi:uncharacterized membrane protein YgcG
VLREHRVQRCLLLCRPGWALPLRLVRLLVVVVVLLVVVVKRHAPTWREISRRWRRSRGCDDGAVGGSSSSSSSSSSSNNSASGAGGVSGVSDAKVVVRRGVPVLM